MKPMKFLSILFLSVFFLSSCSPRLSPFTQRLYSDYNWSDSELKRIQFYVSDDIVLHREAKRGKSEIISGEIKIVDGRRVEEVVIRKGTPGVLLFKPKENRFAVSFEEGSDERFLMFGPSPKASGRYVLLASDWNKRKGKVTYDGKTFTTPSNSAFAALMVDLKKINQVSVKSRQARGRKID